MLNYDLRQGTMEDKEFIYNLKKLVLKAYIDEIWGWDEEYQRKDFGKLIPVHAVLVRRCMSKSTDDIFIFGCGAGQMRG